MLKRMLFLLLVLTVLYPIDTDIPAMRALALFGKAVVITDIQICALQKIVKENN